MSDNAEIVEEAEAPAKNKADTEEQPTEEVRGENLIFFEACCGTRPVQFTATAACYG